MEEDWLLRSAEPDWEEVESQVPRLLVLLDDELWLLLELLLEDGLVELLLEDGLVELLLEDGLVELSGLWLVDELLLDDGLVELLLEDGLVELLLESGVIVVLEEEERSEYPVVELPDLPIAVS